MSVQPYGEHLIEDDTSYCILCGTAIGALLATSPHEKRIRCSGGPQSNVVAISHIVRRRDNIARPEW